MDTNIIFENLEKYLNKRTFKKIGDDFFKGNGLSTDETLKYKFKDEEFLGYRKNGDDDGMIVLESINKSLQKKTLRLLSNEEFKLQGNRFIEEQEIHLFEEYNRIFDKVFEEIIKKIYNQYTTQNTAYGQRIFNDRLCEIIDKYISEVDSNDFEILNRSGKGINILKIFLQKYKAKIQSIVVEEKSKENSEESNLPKAATTQRQVLAMHYIFLELGISQSTDMTTMAEFIRFLTSKERGVKKIKDTNIYKRVKNPTTTPSGYLAKEDLNYVKELFQKLGQNSIVKRIDNDLK